MRRTQANKDRDSGVRAVADQSTAAKHEGSSVAPFTDNNPESLQLSKLQLLADESPQAANAARLQAMADSSPRVVAQRMFLEGLAGRPVQRLEAPKEEELEMMAGSSLIQRKGMEKEEEKPLQGKFGPVQRKENKTGMPDDLKSGVENLSGISMDDVKVHYNSAKPAALHALAYTQGTNIHMGPGQEQHLPHEAWHVAQQKQGRVKPTTQMGGAQINDDLGLEKDADVMGNKAANGPSDKATSSRFISQFVDDRPEAIAQRKTRGTTQMNMNSTSAIQFYPSYQTFQDQDLNTYCSPKKFRNHDEGAAWVRAALQALKVTVRGRPKESNRQPRGAIVGPPWPAATTPAVAPPLDAPSSSSSAYGDSSKSRESKR